MEVKKQLYNIATFMAMILGVFGFIGGVGYCTYEGAYFIAACVLVLGVFAYPKIKEVFKYHFIDD